MSFQYCFMKVFIIIIVCLIASFSNGQDCFKTIKDSELDINVCIKKSWSVNSNSNNRLVISGIGDHNLYIGIENNDSIHDSKNAFESCFELSNINSQNELIGTEHDEDCFWKIFKRNNGYYLQGLIISKNFQYRIYYKTDSFELCKEVITDIKTRLIFLNEKPVLVNMPPRFVAFKVSLVESLENPKLFDGILIDSTFTFDSNIPLKEWGAVIYLFRKEITQNFNSLQMMKKENFELYDIDIVEVVDRGIEGKIINCSLVYFDEEKENKIIVNLVIGEYLDRYCVKAMTEPKLISNLENEYNYMVEVCKYW